MSSDNLPFMMVDGPVFYPGYMFGFDQACMVFKIRFRESSDLFFSKYQRNILRVDQVIRLLAPASEHRNPIGVQDGRLQHLVSWILCLLEDHQHPVFNEPRSMLIDTHGKPTWSVIIPCFDFASALAALEIGLAAMSLVQGENKSTDNLRSQMTDLISRKLPQLKNQSLSGFNVLHFLKEAHNLGIPWFLLCPGVFQLGYGVRSRLLRSSITDVTPNISVAIAKNKQLTNEILRKANLPVPLQAVIHSADAAVAAAKKIGYPVVIKPADLDGGVGVEAFLQDDESIRAAYDRVAKQSKNIVIEKHISGSDYRILVVNGQLLGVLERVPGGVTGDGERSVRQLVELQNHERATAKDDRRFPHPIKQDNEAARMLAEARLTWDDIPPAGSFVRLRAAANVASGGLPKEVSLQDVHPDNIALAQRTARILRLDVAGIDLLIPDIRNSWLDSVAGICEVNAQPQMFTTLHAPMLRALIPSGQGRIPVIIIVTAATDEAFSRAVYERVLSFFPNAGWLAAETVRLGGRPEMHASPQLFDAGRALLIDTSVDALVMTVTRDDVLVSGWPTDRCDALLIVGGDISAKPGISPDQLREIGSSASYLHPKLILIDGDDSTCTSLATETDWVQCDGDLPPPVPLLLNKQEIIAQISSELLCK